MKLKAYFQEDDGLSRLWRRLLNILELDPNADEMENEVAIVEEDECVKILQRGDELGRLEWCWRGNTGSAEIYANNKQCGRFSTMQKIRSQDRGSV